MEQILELWAIVRKSTRTICLTRGGSSSKQKIMVYRTEGKARTALKNPWIKQFIDLEEVEIVKIYDVEKETYESY